MIMVNGHKVGDGAPDVASLSLLDFQYGKLCYLLKKDVVVRLMCMENGDPVATVFWQHWDGGTTEMTAHGTSLANALDQIIESIQAK